MAGSWSASSPATTCCAPWSRCSRRQRSSASASTSRPSPMRDVVIAGACRTPIGTFGGGLKNLTAVDLGTTVVADVLKRARVRPQAVDEVILGNVLQAGLGENPARQCSVKAGVPVEV